MIVFVCCDEGCYERDFNNYLGILLQERSEYEIRYLDKYGQLKLDISNDFRMKRRHIDLLLDMPFHIVSDGLSMTEYIRKCEYIKMSDNMSSFVDDVLSEIDDKMINIISGFQYQHEMDKIYEYARDHDIIWLPLYLSTDESRYFDCRIGPCIDRENILM